MPLFHANSDRHWLPQRSIATQFPGQTNYLKQGLYRNSTIQPTGVVYHDGFVAGETLEDVWPAPGSREYEQGTSFEAGFGGEAGGCSTVPGGLPLAPLVALIGLAIRRRR